MADRKKLPPDYARPPVPGGRTRPSLRVSLAAFSMIARRQALNARLFDATCPFGARPDTKPWHAKDLPILLGIARERFSGEQSLLRRQAILALGRIHAVEAIEALTSLATCASEHGAVRGAAAQALSVLSPAVAARVLEPSTGRRPTRKAKRRPPVRDSSRRGLGGKR
jgi:HEAT repeats